MDLVGQDLERAQQHRPEEGRGDQPDRGRLEQPRQPDDGHGDERKVVLGRAVVHRGDGTRSVHTRSGFAAVQARRSARERVLSTSAGVTHARRAWLIPQRT